MVFSPLADQHTNCLLPGGISLATARQGEEEEGIRRRRSIKEEGEESRKRTAESSMCHHQRIDEPEPVEPWRELVLSSTPFLDPDPMLASLNEPNPGGNDEESRTSLEEELEARGSGEAAARATEEAATRKAAKTPTFISEWSPSSAATAQRTFRYRLSSPNLLDDEGRR
ncbi:hypothetical protein GW17_00025280 [Ensete ventricosum]|nr:hypothetical protein GW17_00025280 [Ensete ventricosum]